VRASEVKVGRTFAVAFDHGDDFMTSLAEFCQDNNLRLGYIPMFLAGYSEVGLYLRKTGKSELTNAVRRAHSGQDMLVTYSSAHAGDAHRHR
jgi:predicted DNA-binding protein with PD1-like motif